MEQILKAVAIFSGISIAVLGFQQYLEQKDAQKKKGRL